MQFFRIPGLSLQLFKYKYLIDNLLIYYILIKKPFLPILNIFSKCKRFSGVNLIDSTENHFDKDINNKVVFWI